MPRSTGTTSGSTLRVRAVLVSLGMLIAAALAVAGTWRSATASDSGVASSVGAPAPMEGDGSTAPAGGRNSPSFYVSLPQHWTSLSPQLEVIVSICHEYGVTDVSVTSPNASVNSDAYAQCAQGQSGTAWFVNWNPGYGTGMNLGPNTFTVYACSNYPAYGCDERTFTYYYELPPDQTTRLQPLDTTKIVTSGKVDTLRFRIRNDVNYARWYDLESYCYRGATGCTVLGGGSVSVPGHGYSDVRVRITGGSVGGGAVRLTACRNVDWQTICAINAQAIPIAPQQPTAKSVTVVANAATVSKDTSAQFSLTYTIGNPGSVSTTYALSTHCDSLVVRQGCVASAATVTVAAAGSAQVTVGPLTAERPLTLTSGLARLTATADAATATAHTAISVGPGGGTGGSAGITVSARAVNQNGSIAHDQCLSFAAGDAAGVECAALRLVHPLPAFQTMSQVRAPMLVYFSRHAHPTQLLAANITTRHATPDTVTVTVALSGGSSLPARKYAWPASCRNAPCRIVYPVPADSISQTGVYQYTLQASFSSGGVVSASDTGSLVVVDRRTSPFGRGWWLEGLEQLVALSDTTKRLWIGGDGSTRVFIKSSANVFVARDSVSRIDTLVRVPGTGWQRLLTNGAFVEFDETGRHVRTVNGLGHVTKMHYVNGRLDSLALPVPSGSTSQPHYRFTYGNNSSTRLSAVKAQRDGHSAQARTVTLATSSSASVSAITDPDGSAVHFDTAGTGGQVRWRRRRISQDTVYFDYDAFGAIAETRVSLSRTLDSTIVHRYCPADTRSLVACGWSEGATGGVPLSSVVTRVDGPRNGLIDVTTFFLNRFGGPDTIVDAGGGRTRLERASPFPALVTKMVDRSGLVQRATYDASGRTTSTTVESPLGTGDHAVTTIRWNSKWSLPDTIIPPIGTPVVFAYDTQYPLTLWRQSGSFTGTRQTMHYNSSDRLLDSMSAPGQKASVVRDPRLGNASYTVSNGLRTDIARDTVGFERVISLVERDTIHKTDSIFRSVTGRVDSSRTTGRAGRRLLSLSEPAWDSFPSRGLILRNSYDAEGNLLQVSQSPREALHSGATTSSAWTYDAARRPRTQRHSNRTDSLWYDPAGLQTVRRTARGYRIHQGYDQLGRLAYRVIPESRVARTTCSACKDALNTLDPVSFPYYGSALIGGGSSTGVEMPADIELFTYDAAGRVTSANNRDARISRSYFPNGALRTDTLRLRNYEPADTLANSYGTHVYALTFSADKLGRRTGRTDSFGWHQSYNYDGLGRLTWTKDSLVAGGGTTRFNFTYNSAGQVTERSVHGALKPIRQINEYDSYGRLIDRTEEGVGPFGEATLFHDSYTYDDFGRQRTRVTVGWSPEVTDSSTMAYDGFGHLVAVTRNRSIGQLGQFTDEFDVDALGNTRATHLNRYIAVGRSLVTASFIADQSDSRIPQPLSSVRDPLDATKPAVKERDLTQNFYDADGNLTFIQQQAHRFWYSQPNGAGGYQDNFNYPFEGSEFTFFAYDPAGRLRVSQKTVDRLPARHIQTEYRYDALGRRVMVRVRSDINSCPDSLSGITGDCRSWLDRFAWDGDQLLVETRILGHQSTPRAALETTTPPSNPFFGRVRYVHAGGIDAPVLVHKSNSVAFVPHASGRGGFEAGTYVSEAEMDDYHWPQRTQGVLLGGDTRIEPPTPIAWFGSLMDGKTDPTGVQYMRNRYYDPASGRFTQPDPIGLAGGLNLYGYANGDPVNLSDPFGLSATPVCFVTPVGAVVCIAAVALPAMVTIASADATAATGLFTRIFAFIEGQTIKTLHAVTFFAIQLFSGIRDMFPKRDHECGPTPHVYEDRFERPNDGVEVRPESTKVRPRSIHTPPCAPQLRPR